MKNKLHTRAGLFADEGAVLDDEVAVDARERHEEARLARLPQELHAETQVIVLRPERPPEETTVHHIIFFKTFYIEACSCPEYIN